MLAVGCDSDPGSGFVASTDEDLTKGAAQRSGGRTSQRTRLGASARPFL